MRVCVCSVYICTYVRMCMHACMQVVCEGIHICTYVHTYAVCVGEHQTCVMLDVSERSCCNVESTDLTIMCENTTMDETSMTKTFLAEDFCQSLQFAKSIHKCVLPEFDVS